ncbi:MAG: nucleotidyltransferase family protein [Desulfuromonas sp.]|nr:nucleotidyltransferase family protein [Desulfuromonas sp.]
MDRDQVLQKLSVHLGEIKHRFSVESLSVFGSMARDEAGPDSDLDILIVYKETPGIFAFLELKDYLEKTVNRPVDLVTDKALKEQLRDSIMQEAVRVS